MMSQKIKFCLNSNKLILLGVPNGIKYEGMVEYNTLDYHLLTIGNTWKRGIALGVQSGQLYFVVGTDWHKVALTN